MSPEERNQLIDDLLDGSISEADFLRLEAEMDVSREARDAYYDRVSLTTMLRDEAGISSSKTTIAPFPRSSHARIAVPSAVAAAIIALAAIGGWVLGHRSGDVSPRLAQQEPEASGFAVLSESSGAKWTSDFSLSRGDLVPGGPLTLQEGTIQLDLFSGVTVVVEGGTEFEVISPMELFVTRGKVRAQVPEPAQGFRIRTHTGDLVDLGTEFSLDVTPDHADVSVVDGKVEWHRGDELVRTLVEGEAYRHGLDGNDEEISFKEDSVRRITDVEKELLSQRKERRETWLAHRSSFANDPRLLVYYPMTGNSGSRRELVDASPNHRNGVIVGAHRTADRWGTDNAAIDFSPAGSRVRTVIPGEFESVTFYCWVRIDSVDRWYNSLFLTDGHELHEPHWQIMNDGRMFFSVKAVEERGKKDKYIAYSPSIWTPADSGKWMQLATVYDGKNYTTTHYSNGKEISRDVIPNGLRPDKVTIASASIGNWSEPRHRTDPEFAVRNLNGAIDEFAIFSEALSGDEIQTLYQLGRP